MNIIRILLDYDEVTGRAQPAIEADRAKIQPLTLAYFKASASMIGTVVGGLTEGVSVLTAFSTAWPALSSGQDLAAAFRPMAYTIPLYMPLGHIVLRNAIDQFGRPVGWLVNAISIVPVLVILGGIATFMFGATAQTTGGDDGGTLAGLTGGAIGIACAGLFSASFFACHVLAGKFLASFRTIVAGRAQRARVADIERELKLADEHRASIEATRLDIAAKEKPDALCWKAAADAAAIVGSVAAEAHDLHASREAHGEVELADHITSDVHDVPVEALDRLQKYLKQFTTKYFFDQLKSKEA